MNVLETAQQLKTYIRRLRRKRRRWILKRREVRGNRRALSKLQREAVLRKTDGSCHICGGKREDNWQADHVRAYATGGSHAEDNYVAAHATCDNCRWSYLPEEFEIIVKLGVWARTQIEKDTPMGVKIASRFMTHERGRLKRRKPGT